MCCLSSPSHCNPPEDPSLAAFNKLLSPSVRVRVLEPCRRVQRPGKQRKRPQLMQLEASILQRMTGCFIGNYMSLDLCWMERWGGVVRGLRRLFRQRYVSLLPRQASPTAPGQFTDTDLHLNTTWLQLMSIHRVQRREILRGWEWSDKWMGNTERADTEV